MSDVNNNVKNYIVFINTTAYYLFWTSKVAHYLLLKIPVEPVSRNFIRQTQRERDREREEGIIKEIPDGIILRKVFSSPGKISPETVYCVHKMEFATQKIQFISWRTKSVFCH